MLLPFSFAIKILYAFTVSSTSATSSTHLILILIRSFSHQSLYSPLLGPDRFLSFIFLHTVGMTPWTGDQPVPRLLPIHRRAQTQNKRANRSMPKVRFEPTTPVLERAKTVQALYNAATVIGPYFDCHNNI
jgi:hypothetical protein